MKKFLFTFSLIGLFILLGLAACNGTQTPTSSGPAASTQAPAACELSIPADGAKTILIPAGTFQMGSPLSAIGASTNETPEHPVTLPCFSIYEEEVTNFMYSKCVAAGGCVPVSPVAGTPSENYSNIVYADYPVVGVDYNMATDYCAWAGGRLPTEAEWEYAAVGTANSTYPWGGQDPSCDLANYKDCRDPAATVPGSSLKNGESPFKVQDLSGNAWEWVFDWYDAKYYSSLASSSPVGPSTGVTKVVRGGSFSSEASTLRAANRHAGKPYTAYSNVGFRCVIGPALNLPADYQKPDGSTHNVPLGGDPVDDDDPQGNPNAQFEGWVNFGELDCPDPNGDLHFTFRVVSDSPYSISNSKVEGNPIDCVYDGASEIYTCTAPEPAPNQSNFWWLSFTITSPALNAPLDIQLPYSKPQNCDSQNGPFSISATIGCPSNGVLSVVFTYDPPINWTMVENSGGDSLACVTTSPNTLKCFASDILDNGLYRFHLEGDYQYDFYAANIAFQPLPNCGGTSDAGMDFAAVCLHNEQANANIPTLAIFYQPPNTPPQRAQIVADDLLCQNVGPGFTTCPIPQQYEGLNHVLVISCFEANSNCHQGHVDVPADCESSQVGPSMETMPICSADNLSLMVATDPADAEWQIKFNNEPWICPDITPVLSLCDLPDNLEGGSVHVDEWIKNGDGKSYDLALPICGEDQNNAIFGYKCEGETPTINVMYKPVDAAVTVRLEGNDMYCVTESNVDQYGNVHMHCVIPESMNSGPRQVEVCVNGDCETQTFLMDSCTSEEVGGQNQCKIYDAQCLSQTQISFLMDVFDKDTLQGVAIQDGSVSAYMGNHNFDFTCALNPNVTGRVYCTGPFPGYAQWGIRVDFKLADSGEARWCGLDVDDWNDVLPGCAGSQQPENPPPTCSAITSKSTCIATYGCEWVLINQGGALKEICQNK